MKSLFVRLMDAEDKAEALKEAIADHASPRRFEVNPESFVTMPRAPFAYWASEQEQRVFRDMSRFEANGRTAKQGLATADDFRFIRHWVEVPAAASGTSWFSFAKGGEFSRHYCDVCLVLNWACAGAEMKSWAGSLYNNSHWSRILKNIDLYYRPGLTWPLRTNGLSFRVMPANCIFGHKGPATFARGDDHTELLALCAVLNSTPFGALVSLQLARTELAQSYEVGLIKSTPVPTLNAAVRDHLAGLARNAWSLKRSLDTQMETSHTFVLPALLQASSGTLAARADRWADQVTRTDALLAEMQDKIDRACLDLYGISEKDRWRTHPRLPGRAVGEVTEPVDGDEKEGATGTEPDATRQVFSLLSWAMGVAFGRFDLRYATGEFPFPPETEPFSPLPVCSPGMLTGDDGRPLDAPPSGYAIHCSGDGILVDDVGVDDDLPAAARRVFEPIFDDPSARWAEAAEILGDHDGDLRGWFARKFFELHIKRYKMSRRKAPIYWQLATPTASYSAWLYYHRLSRDTLFRLLNDHVVPKLQHEEGKLTSLTQEAGSSPTASQRRLIDNQRRFVAELRAFRDEVAHVAPLWNPDLNDGVIINFAPLWRLVPQNRSWQKQCKNVWDKLVAGDYDWAHLAMHLWPERVVPRCAGDRSLAIAHGLDRAFWEEDQDGKWKPRSVPRHVVDHVVNERTSAAVKSAVVDLLRAPGPGTPSQARRVRRGRRALSE